MLKRLLVLTAVVVGILAIATPRATTQPRNDISAPGAAAKHWTREAMRAAVPLDLLSTSSRGSDDVGRGMPQTVHGTPGPLVFPSTGSPWLGGGRVTRTTGRVFFTYQGSDASCSGNAVTSNNRSTVITAGHCIKLGGAYHTNWVFVPGYYNGNAPFGVWPAEVVVVTPQWHATEDIDYDVGAAVVQPRNGVLLTDLVGSTGIAFNQSRVQNMYAFGYPAADQYDGRRLIYCSGTTFPARLSTGIGMACDMTGGASGGPWFTKFNEPLGTGVQNSVNSYKIQGMPLWVFGPYFGTDAQELYQTASNI